MLLSEVVDSLNLQVLSRGNLEVEVRSGIISDLLSYVIGNAKEGDVWLTIQTHMNVVAVASLCKVAAVVVTSDLEVSEEVIAKAQEEGITILKSSLTSYELAGNLFLSGIR